MAERSSIEWTDATFNPWIGCTKVGPGCDHCYAEQQDRFRKWTPMGWGAGLPRRRTSESLWAQPLKWNAEPFLQCLKCGWRGTQAQIEKFDCCEAHQLTGARRRVFCASLADVFDNEVPEEWRYDLFDLWDRTPNLDWLVLTKRIGNAAKMLPWIADDEFEGCEPLRNVWLGATVVNQEEADRDIPKLLATPARVRFLSMEPLLGAVTLPGFNSSTSWCPVCKAIVPESLMPGHEMQVHHRRIGERFDPQQDCASVYNLIDWVIVGGESGPKARPMHSEWARSLRDQCAAAGVPFLFKQWGECVPATANADGSFEVDDGIAFDHERGPDRLRIGWVDAAGAEGGWYYARVGKARAGRVLDGVTHDGFPEVTS